MPRIFVLPDSLNGDIVSLPPDDAKRLYKVLRMHPGDSVTLFDGTDEYDTVITALGPKSATLKITAKINRQDAPALEILLGQGMPKGEKLEWVVQKASELGVSAVVPVIMGRSVKRPDVTGAEKKLIRLRKIAAEAARQCGRVSVPDIPCYMDLPMFLEAASGFGLKILFYEGAKTAGLRPLLHGLSGVEKVAVLIGPEGGLSPEEADEAEAAGFIAAGLGPRILRTETAGLAAISIIQYELGDMGSV